MKLFGVEKIHKISPRKYFIILQIEWNFYNKFVSHSLCAFELYFSLVKFDDDFYDRYPELCGLFRLESLTFCTVNGSNITDRNLVGIPIPLSSTTTFASSY